MALLSRQSPNPIVANAQSCGGKVGLSPEQHTAPKTRADYTIDFPPTWIPGLAGSLTLSEGRRYTAWAAAKFPPATSRRGDGKDVTCWNLSRLTSFTNE
jgi:hypothetical protein